MQSLNSVYVWRVDQIERQRPPTDILSLQSVRLHYLLLPIGCPYDCLLLKRKTNETEFFDNSVVLYRCTLICIYDTSHKSYLQMQSTITNTSLSPSLSRSLCSCRRKRWFNVYNTGQTDDENKSIRATGDLSEQRQCISTSVLHFFCRYATFDQYWFIIKSVDEANTSSFVFLSTSTMTNKKNEIESRCEMQSLFYWHLSDIFLDLEKGNLALKTGEAVRRQIRINKARTRRKKQKERITWWGSD